MNIENNFSCHIAKDDQKLRYDELSKQFCNLAVLIDQLCPNSREKSLAFTNLEQSIMWANAAIARNE